MTLDGAYYHLCGALPLLFEGGDGTQEGNRYTFRLRASTYMQAAMLVPEAAKLKKKRWAVVYPNYEYGQSAVATFKQLLKAAQPDVEFVAEQAPALGKVDAGAVAQALADLDTPLSLYLKLTQGRPLSFLLESVVGGERFGRYSFVGLPARTLVRATEREVEVVTDGEVVERDGQVVCACGEELQRADRPAVAIVRHRRREKRKGDMR